PPFHQLLFFGCACVRRVLHLLSAKDSEVLDLLDHTVENKKRISSGAHTLVELSGAQGSAEHAAGQALHALIDAVWAGKSRPTELSNAVFVAADAVAVAEGMAAVPTTAAEQGGLPAFLADPNRWGGGGRGRIPHGRVSGPVP